MLKALQFDRWFMNLLSARPRLFAGLLVVSAVLGANGCSFFFDLNTTQCEKTSDCQALGPQFETTICVNRVCVEEDEGSGGTSSDGGSSGSAGKSSTGGSNQSGGTVGEGGEPSEGGGSAGSREPEPECTTNEQCIKTNLDQPYICRNDKCVSLITDECPQLLPTNNTIALLKSKKTPIILGGFASMSNPQDSHDTQAVINWDLAFDEFNTALGVGSKQPPMLGLICQGLASELDLPTSMAHLTQEVGVPGVLTTLSADNLSAAWEFTQAEDYPDSGAQPVFFMSTGSADLRLANLDDNGLVWHMLGDPRVLAATTVALIKRIEPQVNAVREEYFQAHIGEPGVEDPDEVPLRVTLVYSDDPTMTDVAKVLTTSDLDHPETQLAFNGALANDALNSNNFRQVKIESIRYHQTPIVSNGTSDLREHPPHIVLGMATGEFPFLMSSLEQNWSMSNAATSSLPRPFYVLSQLLYNNSDLRLPMDVYAATTPRALNRRTVGVNYAQAQDARSKGLYDSYLATLKSGYLGELDLAGTENYYDGAYSLLYSLAAVSSTYPSPTGTNVRDGWLERVISQSGSASSVNVGYAAVADTVAKMAGASTYRMALWGTMGAPNFDRLSGTRVTASSAWCIQRQDDANTSQPFEYQADGLNFDADDHEFSDPSSGVPRCLQGYEVAP